jgi:hypothetical protein
VQPCSKSALTAELFELVPCLDEGFLGAILGFRHVAGHTQAKPINLIDMHAVEPLERAGISLLRPGNPVGFVSNPGFG